MAPARARPDGSGYTLRWSRSSEAQACPDRERLVSVLALQLGRDPFDSETDHDVVVELSRRGSIWLATLRARNSDGIEIGSQQLTSASADCDEVFRAAVAALAVMLGGVAQPRPEEPERAAADMSRKKSHQPKPQPAARQDPEPATVARRMPRSSSRVPAQEARTWVGLGGGTALGIGSWLSPAVSLSLGYENPDGSYGGFHSSFVFGRSEGDAPVDRLHHHSLELGWVIGEQVFINPGIRVGALFLASGGEEPSSSSWPVLAAGASAGTYLAKPVYLGLDLRAVYVFGGLVRGSGATAWHALPMHIVAGMTL